ncbi:MAG: AAA domain-containing protein [Steroidobacteraceae bacterium]
MPERNGQTPDTDPAGTLGDRIAGLLQSQPQQKAGDLARVLGADRRDVNRCLYHDLAGRVVQDASYRWRLSTRPDGRVPGTVRPAPQSEIARLCRYYLECIGVDSDKGVRAFASSRFGTPDYVELPSLPLLPSDRTWWTEPGVEQVVSKVRSDRNRLIAWVGYPVRLREHRTANWRGFFVEPVFLWQVVLPEHPGDPFQFADELPVPNFAFLRSVANGDQNQIADEAARLDDDLGLNSSPEDRPDVDELIARLVSVRRDWDWRESIDPERCVAEPRLANLQESGIYNRAIIIPGERSPFTVGLETELTALGEKNESELRNTALGNWLCSDVSGGNAPDERPLIEVLPMNTEQRAAVSAALSAKHTVVTGPPGTGKSQVVTNLLVNAAWRGMKVLFASKNNKAVDVVEARINGLGNRPVLLRLGSKEYQAKLAEYLVAMLSGTVTENDKVSYAEGLERHSRLSSKAAELAQLQIRTMEVRNLVDRLEQQIDGQRTLFTPDRFNSLDVGALDGAESASAELAFAIERLDSSSMGPAGRIVLWLFRKQRIEKLESVFNFVREFAQHLELPTLPVADVTDLGGVRCWREELTQRITSARNILKYQQALEALRRSRPLEELARELLELNEQIGSNSISLWRDWVQLTPTRLTDGQRRDIAEYTALLQLISGPDGEAVNSTVKRRARELQPRVTALFSCWAVTSLSAKGKVPFDPGAFDLVVVDEASQCDIASALPLLYRAKRSVIIGDPMQLRHISALGKARDTDLQAKYDLVGARTSWAYSVTSLYDLAAGISRTDQIVNLRDHHRCHADIIGFSNRLFYGGNLRVATRYSNLRRRSNSDPGVIWQDVRGSVTRPDGSGARNVAEARAVRDALHDLLVVRQYKETVGIVTPFRSQAQLLQEMVAASPELSALGPRCDLLVDTVHKFQGDERDVMFFSPVVSDSIAPGALGFLRSNGNLFNVAVTRARGLLHVVGDRSAAGSSGVDWLERFSEYVAGLGIAQGEGEALQVPELGPEYPRVARPERVSDWEKVLYKALYHAGVRPIPQYSVEQYDLDFALVSGSRRLNIEVDGEKYHRSWTGELCVRDQLRNQRLIELGWEVKRFWVYEVRDRLDDVVAGIVKWSAGNK